MSSTQPHQRTPGSPAAAVSNHVVRLFAQYTGRGPTKARTIIDGHVAICVTQKSMTKAERRLVAEGESDLVVSIRRTFQTTMRGDLVGAVEAVIGQKVLSFMSDHDAEHDYAAEVFVLDGPPKSSYPHGEEQAPLES